MRGSVGSRLFALCRRLRRIERREVHAFRRWVEQTSNLLHLSVLLFVPLLVAVVTALADRIQPLSFLLFPPLASGTYTLFANPEGKYASPARFVAGLTLGALCGWAALWLGGALGVDGPSGALGVGAFDAATAVFLTGVVTWALDVEEASAFSTALLGLLVPRGDEFAFTASVFAASAIVAGVFEVWRTRFYEQRARLIYESTKGDDHVLVPMRGENPGETAMLGARLADAHDAGKVVLLDVVDDEEIAAAERDLLDQYRRADRPVATDGGTDAADGGDDAETASAETDGDDAAATDASGTVADDPAGPAGDDATQADDTAQTGGDEATQAEGDEADVTDAEMEELAEQQVADEAATRLEMRAAEIETEVGVPCEVVVAVDGGVPAATVHAVADETNCDLIAAAYEQRHGGLSPYVRELFAGDTDVLVHRSADGRTDWSRVLVPVRRASDVAHSMLDFAARLAAGTGRISVATCVERDRDRRRGEEMLANLAETLAEPVETRVSTVDIETFLERNQRAYDLIIMGASTDRSAASRLISPPTFERVQDLDADVMIVDRA